MPCTALAPPPRLEASAALDISLALWTRSSDAGDLYLVAIGLSGTAGGIAVGGGGLAGTSLGVVGLVLDPVGGLAASKAVGMLIVP